MDAPCHPCLRIDENTIHYTMQYNRLTNHHKPTVLYRQEESKLKMSTQHCFNATYFLQVMVSLSDHFHYGLPQTGNKETSGKRSIQLNSSQSNRAV